MGVGKDCHSLPALAGQNELASNAKSCRSQHVIRKDQDMLGVSTESCLFTVICMCWFIYRFLYWTFGSDEAEIV
jgi:hypothetical protein